MDAKLSLSGVVRRERKIQPQMDADLRRWRGVMPKSWSVPRLRGRGVAARGAVVSQETQRDRVFPFSALRIAPFEDLDRNLILKVLLLPTPGPVCIS